MQHSKNDIPSAFVWTGEAPLKLSPQVSAAPDPILSIERTEGKCSHTNDDEAQGLYEDSTRSSSPVPVVPPRSSSSSTDILDRESVQHSANNNSSNHSSLEDAEERWRTAQTLLLQYRRHLAQVMRTAAAAEADRDLVDIKCRRVEAELAQMRVAASSATLAVTNNDLQQYITPVVEVNEAHTRNDTELMKELRKHIAMLEEDCASKDKRIAHLQEQLTTTRAAALTVLESTDRPSTGEPAMASESKKNSLLSPQLNDTQYSDECDHRWREAVRDGWQFVSALVAVTEQDNFMPAAMLEGQKQALVNLQARLASMSEAINISATDALECLRDERKAIAGLVSSAAACLESTNAQLAIYDDELARSRSMLATRMAEVEKDYDITVEELHATIAELEEKLAGVVGSNQQPWTAGVPNMAYSASTSGAGAGAGSGGAASQMMVTPTVAVTGGSAMGGGPGGGTATRNFINIGCPSSFRQQPRRVRAIHQARGLPGIGAPPSAFMTASGPPSSRPGVDTGTQTALSLEFVKAMMAFGSERSSQSPTVMSTSDMARSSSISSPSGLQPAGGTAGLQRAQRREKEAELVDLLATEVENLSTELATQNALVQALQVQRRRFLSQVDVPVSFLERTALRSRVL